MPSDQEIQEIAEDWKKRGNEAFQKSELQDAIKAYSQGIVQVDRLVTPAVLLKVALLSNRAACYLKTGQLDECVQDCSLALTVMGQASDAKLRSKVLFRRGKARFLRANMPSIKSVLSPSSSPISNGGGEDLQLAAKDLVTLLSFDPTNKDANQLLQTIRAQHAVESKNKVSNSPMAKTLDGIKKKDDKILHNVKVLLGILTNDQISASMEFGRLGGVDVILNELVHDEALEVKVKSLAMQCLSCAASHPPFCRKFLVFDGLQKQLLDIVTKTANQVELDDVTVSALAVFLRLILHLDRDVEGQEIVGTNLLEYDAIIKSLIAVFQSENTKLIRAGLDVLSTWISGKERENIIRASLVDTNFVDLPPKKTLYETRQLTPQALSKYKQRLHQQKTRDQAWAFERSTLLQRNGGLDTLLQCAITTEDTTLRKEITVSIGKLLVALEAEDKVKDAIKDIMGSKFVKAKKKKESDDKKKDLGVVIEEINDDDEEGKVVDVTDDDEEEKVEELFNPRPVTFELKMQRAELASAILLAKTEEIEDIGWVLGSGWPTCRRDLDDLVNAKDNKIALCLVAELMTSAASVKETRPMVATMVEPQALKDLVGSQDSDIRTAAASAIAKLGLAEKGTKESEIIGLMEAACFMLEDGEEQNNENNGKKTDASTKTNQFLSQMPKSSSDPTNKTATSAIERGVEVIAYLVSKTQVKEEIAHGFQGRPDSKKTALQLLVDVADMPNAGESLTAYGLVSIFQHMSVTAFQLRKEAFEGKPVTMEQYDEIQNMAKTEEEKDLQDESEVHDNDTEEQCAERVRKMTQANVPRALIQLIQGATDHTMEGLVTALNRMASEASVRGQMIQQGVLSGLIKFDKEEKTPTDTKKKILRVSRHCMAKMLITINPGILTSAQRMGSVKPLILLVRDVNATNLQQFEALMALTNLAALDDTKNKIVTEKGIPSLNFAMFSEHEMVKQAATEAMCNLVPHEKMLEYLRERDNLRLWLALASDYEENYETARAAAGGLAMATLDEGIATTLISIHNFKERMDSILESGRLELMHRILVVILNLAQAGGKFREAVFEHGLFTFAHAYVQSYHDGSKAEELEFGKEDMGLFKITVQVAKQIVHACDKKN